MDLNNKHITSNSFLYARNSNISSLDDDDDNQPPPLVLPWSKPPKKKTSTEKIIHSSFSVYEDETFILNDLDHSETTTEESYDLHNHNSQQQQEQRTTKVKRTLKPRHISMIALGGTIGSGLFVATSTPLSIAGPVNSLIAYIFMGTLVYSVAQSLGEMATFIPVTSSLTVFSKRFLSPALGVSNGYMYWFSWVITFALELSIVGQIIEFWTDAVPLAAWISIFWVILVSINMFPVKYYGEIEFWISSIKVVSIVGFIIYAFIMVCGGGPLGAIGFRYWRNPGPWGPGHLFPGTPKGRFLGWVSSLINSTFTYQGTELVGISAGESRNPRKAVPKAINVVFFRILIFYVLSLLFLGLLVPFNDPKLSSKTSYVASSPFIIAIENCKTKGLPDLFNAIILMTIISAGNSNVYVSSRILYSLSKNGVSPRIFSRTNKYGVPHWAVLFSGSFGALGYLASTENGISAFNWLLNITAVAGLFAWLFISISHIRFMQALKSRGISRDSLPFKAYLMPYSAYYAAGFSILIIFINGYESFVGGFSVSAFFTAYISAIIFVCLWICFQVYFKSWKIFIPLHEIDIDTDRREIDAMVWDDEPEKNFCEKIWDFLF
ncbi:hypothetical protein WICPIJ_005170 [Wickerhamomyces pijperi]|uniref:Amino acid permease/ SLC12A domain-containing protein n=1 Tax=Wickerhamomyces pijperi TaxID=599730 RepID=A0A9P8TLD1_WICPI|nr:hypothetical protein WICPIJ_005170 [Wickerhamomyces pijperi]